MTRTGPDRETRRHLRHHLDKIGLSVLGHFRPQPKEPGLGGIGTVVLVGNAGHGFWPVVRQEIAACADPDPLDAWSRKVFDRIARSLEVRVIFPFEGPPYAPFDAWALRCGTMIRSPLGLLLHRDHGLWHAFRAALLFATPLDLAAPEPFPVPCDTCAERPCLVACPAGAHSLAGYDLGACTSHLKSEAGTDCRDQGCRARRACPVGREHAYPSDQMRFHMRAFVKTYG